MRTVVRVGVASGSGALRGVDSTGAGASMPSRALSTYDTPVSVARCLRVSGGVDDRGSTDGT